MSLSLSQRLHHAWKVEESIYGHTTTTHPRNRNQFNFCCETNKRIYDAISTHQMTTDAQTVFRGLQYAATYDRELYSSNLSVTENMFIDRLFDVVAEWDRSQIASLWYCKLVGDVETTLCNAIPLTYSSTIFFADRTIHDTLTSSLDDTTSTWSRHELITSTQYVQYAHAFLRMLNYGMMRI
jgi:hypothetical protein